MTQRAVRLTRLAGLAVLLCLAVGMKTFSPPIGETGSLSSSSSGSAPSDLSAGTEGGNSSASPSSPSSAGSEGNVSSSTSASNGTTETLPPASSGSSSASAGRQTGTTSPSSTSPATVPSGKILTGYYTGWSSYKGYTPEKIPVGQLTYLNYAFAKIDSSTGRIALADPANDRRNFAGIRSLKKKNSRLKTLISIGGWDYSTYFSDIASTDARRETFAQSCLDFILEHGFDGIDLDWEYPVSGGLAGNTNRPQDKRNFTLLLETIRKKLNEQEKKDGRRYFLTIAGAANTSYLSKIEPVAVANLVDYLFVMAYDIHGPWDSYADFNAPLYPSGENSPQYQNSVYDGIAAYRNSGVPADKLVLGMPFYGYIYQGVTHQNNGLYSRFSSAKSAGYDAICGAYLNNSAYQQFRFAAAQVPYLYGESTFITYEDAQSIAAKTALANTQGLAGVGIWELSYDSEGVLLKSAFSRLRN